MTIPQIVFLLMVMLLAAILVEPIAKRLRLPFSAALVLIGFLGSEALVSQGIDTGIRWHNFTELIFYVFIPVLVFESAFRLNLRLLLRDLVPILCLAIPLMLVAALVTAVILYYGIAHPKGFPWMAALLAGALLSATDPVAVLSMLKENKAPGRLNVLLEGESLFNDATAIVLFGILISFALSDSGPPNWNVAATEFLRVFFGGLAVGLALGVIAYVLIKVLRRAVLAAVITVISAYSSYLLSEDALRFSGVMAVLSCGLLLGELHRRQPDVAGGNFIESLWDFNAYVATAMIFLLAGVTVTIAMFTGQWLAMLIGIGAATLARLISVFTFLPVVGWLPGIEPIPMGQQAVVAWGGVRGAVTLALALSLPLELDFWFTVQSIAYGVVLFNLFIQTPTMPPLIRRAI